MNNKKIHLKEAISIGIGGMVGGGIFAVLGLAVSLAQGGTPVSFFIAGLIALITSYSYVKLSLSFPDRGGTVKFINKGFGTSVFSGTINNLLWISYIIMLALYASAFGSYAPNLLELTTNQTTDSHIYSTSIIIFATAINYYSIKVVGKIESYAVIIKLVILLTFVVIGLYGLIGNPNLEQLNISKWESPINLLAAGMVIFVAYEGFELIANAAPDIINPIKNIPKAYYYSVIFVIILYITIATITVGSLLGKIGFTIITIAALISTFSAINASLYGGSRVSYEIAQDDELPHELTSKLWNQPIGLLITAIATIILVNVLHLESISITGSIGFLIVFAIVNYIGFKLSKRINGNKIIPFIGFISCIIALATLIIQQYKTNVVGIIISLTILLGCFIFELIYKKQH